MKLRNIFLASLVACSLASCSKDDDIDKGPVGPVDASVSFVANMDLLTKAVSDGGKADGDKNEQTIHELTALIYDANNKLVKRKDTVRAAGNTGSITAIEHIEFKISLAKGEQVSSEQFTAVLFANAKDELKNVSTLDDLRSNNLTKKIDNYSFGLKNGTVYLPMISGELKFSGLKPLGDSHIENWITSSGIQTAKPSDATKAIPLTRLVARVQLEKLELSFVNTDYPNGKFELTRVFLANVASQSPFHLLSDVENAADLWKGYQSDSFKVKQQIVIPAKNKQEGVVVDDENVKSMLSKNFTDKSKYTFTSGKTVVFEEDKPIFYTFAYNGTKKASQEATNSYQTRLIVEGLFYRREGSQPELRHFHVVIKNLDNSIKVIPNTFYQLSVKIEGEGSPNEDDILTNADVSVDIKVAPWKVIDQIENDDNK